MNILEFALAKKMGGPGGVPINNQDKTITQNGTYTADEGFTGLGTVNVSVAREDQMDIAAQLNGTIDRSITEVSSNVTSVGGYAFYKCNQLTTAEFPSATSIGIYAFYNCGKLITVDAPAVTDIGDYAFNSCRKLTAVNFPLATSISNYAFQMCDAITEANFPVATKVPYMGFSGCKTLTAVNFPVATSIGRTAFQSCRALTTVNFPAVTSIESEAFEGCNLLPAVDLPATTSIGSEAFFDCYRLTALILRSETMCTLSNTNAFTNCHHFNGKQHSTHNPEGLKDGYIYVPRALVDSYKAATNWSTYASQFRALEDYTVDGTTAGALDESKI